MKRLIEYSVFAGLVTAWRRATRPTSRSPFLANATTDGVVRKPSAFAITLGSPPSMTATHELVVPRSMPMTLPMSDGSPGIPKPRPARVAGRGLECVQDEAKLVDLHLDVARLGLVGLGHVDLEHAVSVRRLHLVGADRQAERERPLERTVGALGAVQRAFRRLLLALALAAQRERVVVDRDLHVLRAHARKVRAEHVGVGRLLDVHRRRERAPLRTERRRAEEVFEQATQLGVELERLEAIATRKPANE